MKVAISNFGEPCYPADAPDFRAWWREFRKPPPPRRMTLFEHPHEWGFHIFSIGVHLLDLGVARQMEFWNFAPRRQFWWHPCGFYWMDFLNQDDLEAYLEIAGEPDLYIQHGACAGRGVLRRLHGRSFRVYVPALRMVAEERTGNFDAECYLVDAPEYLDARSMMYVPVVNTRWVRPARVVRRYDFIYLAQGRRPKRHDIVIDAARGATLSGHFHPVIAGQFDLDGARITTSDWNQRDVVELLQAARIAVYPGIHESSPAAMWECVAADLPIVVHERIEGGRHVVEPGVTGELANETSFREVMQQVLARRASYAPRAYLLEHWDTVEQIGRYLEFFRRMGWSG